MSSEEVGNTVAGLGGKMDMVIEMLRDLQKDLKSNYMPSAQIEDRFKAQGERIGLVEKSYSEAIARIEGTMKTMDQDVKDKFMAAEKKDDQKKENPYKVIFALCALVGLIGTVTGGIIWLIHVVK